MKVSDYAGLAVAGIVIYGAYKLFKGVQALNPLDDLKNALNSLKAGATEAARRIENPLNIQQPPAYAFDFTGLNEPATTQRLIASFDFTQPTTRTELTTAPLFQGAGMGSNQTISTQPAITDYSFGVNTGVSLAPIGTIMPLSPLGETAYQNFLSMYG
jgi:hypothetical protein